MWFRLNLAFLFIACSLLALCRASTVARVLDDLTRVWSELVTLDKAIAGGHGTVIAPAAVAHHFHSIAIKTRNTAKDTKVSNANIYLIPQFKSCVNPINRICRP
jgi:hypothetical protein